MIIIIIRKPCQRWGKRAVLRLDLKVDRVAVCLRESIQRYTKYTKYTKDIVKDLT